MAAVRKSKIKPHSAFSWGSSLAFANHAASNVKHPPMAVNTQPRKANKAWAVNGIMAAIPTARADKAAITLLFLISSPHNHNFKPKPANPPAIAPAASIPSPIGAPTPVAISAAAVTPIAAPTPAAPKALPISSPMKPDVA